MVRPIGDRKSSIAPLANYKWKHTVDAIQGLTAFDPDPYDGFAVEYINPSNGKQLIQRWQPGCNTYQAALQRKHQTYSFYHLSG